MLENRRTIDTERLLDEAERDWVLDGTAFFKFPIRRKPGFEDFYEILERELREFQWLKVAEFRTVKEGFVRVSRPSVLQLKQEDLCLQRPYLRALVEEVRKWQAEFADLGINSALRVAYKEFTADPQLSRSCLEVMNYLIRHRDEVRDLLPRQVQHANSTKLIGKESLLLRLFGIWRGETATWRDFFRFFELQDKPVEFRFFASRCSFKKAELTSFHGLIALDWAQDYDFSGLDGTLIIENLESFYAEIPHSQNRLLIWGSGWKAISLKRLTRLLPKPILYWGDIDKEGYEIYGLLKSHIPDIKAVLMDQTIIDRFVHLAIPREKYFGPFRSAGDLQHEYQDVCQRGICIEQEKVHDHP